MDELLYNFAHNVLIAGLQANLSLEYTLDYIKQKLEEFETILEATIPQTIVEIGDELKKLK